jgi:glycosyltransferase involved in cell wall biosynthesis
VVALLDRGLSAAGHRSIVIAAEGSTVCGELISPFVSPLDRESSYRQWNEALHDTLKVSGIDLVHLHGLDFDRYLPPAGLPALATLHLPPALFDPRIFTLARPLTWLNCVSTTQLRMCQPSELLTGVVENGVPLDVLRPQPRRTRGYALAIGRICPEKGFHLAVDAAESAGVPLYLAGRVFPYPEHECYWRTVLEPRLRPPHRFLGALGLAGKAAWMASARCLVAPSLVAETCSLVAIESLACGTPVVAFPSGALAEVVEHGRTGYLAGTVSEMAQGIRDADSIDRVRCRRAAESRFSAERMCRQYFALYGQLIGRRCAAAPAY